MPRIRVVGGQRLVGQISISGAKNAALPLMAASLLTDETLTLENLPRLADIATLSSLLEHHGVTIEVNGGNGPNKGRIAHFHAADIADTTAPYDLVRKMRASVLVLGPIIARCGEARVSQPGGCAIGTRPVDLHLKGLQELGAEIELDGGYIEARAPNGLVGGQVVFPFVSVGATENLMMAAALAKGRTTLLNAAREPEVQDLGHCLQAMGAQIKGIGTDTITIDGGRGAARCRALGITRPDRDGHVRRGCGHHGRRRRAFGSGPYAYRKFCGCDESGRNFDGTDGCGHSCHGDKRSRRWRRRNDRAVSWISDRPPGAIHGIDDGREWGGDGHGDDLREPVHARS